MKFIAKSLIAGAIALLPFAAAAQQSDTDYCQALADKYRRYVADNQNTRRVESNLSADMAMSQCPTKPSEAIPTLERALKNAMVDLPKR